MRLPILALAAAALSLPALAEPPAAVQEAAVEEETTLVIGTRFVSPPAEDASPKALFTEARIPLGAFNETDHCVDQAALEAAQEYFATLGHILNKAGYFYIVPDDAVKQAVSMCVRTHGAPPQAWVEAKTKVVAFGRVVPTQAAPALERSIR